MVDATHCPACGHVNAVAAEACASCGEPLSVADIRVHPGETFRDPDDLSFPDAAPLESDAEALRSIAERMTHARAASATLAAAESAAGTRPAHYAGFVIRAVAFVIDGLVLTAFTVPLGIAGIYGVKAGLVASGTDVGFLETEEALGRLLGLAWLAMATIYFTALHRKTGQTIGKAVLGIAVRRARDLAGIGIVRSLIRVVGYALSTAVFFLGFLSIILGPRKRGWHDYLAGTCVVHLAPEEV
jgi:uncharacterized RDD family membrane protein YckC